MTQQELQKLQDLAKKWDEPVRSTDDDPEYDAGREVGRGGCADELRELLTELRRNPA